MSFPCKKCGFLTLRPSRYRRGDLSRMLLLRFPVRCTTCMARYFVSLAEHRKIRNAQRKKTHG